MHQDGDVRGPLVSVLLPTYNRRLYLPHALDSVMRQTYRNLEVFVVNDGGEDVADIVRSCGDERVVFINRRENRGKPYSLNEALGRARGKYVAYLDDDDAYYPNHIGVLVRALECQTDSAVAYTDLYKTYCDVSPTGQRLVLSKDVEISRDFDRHLMLYFNHVLHVSLMHRRDMLEKTGLYNERLNIMIDWDMTRRLVFFSDFFPVHEITGEFYSPVRRSDRISVVQRKNSEEYLRNVLEIRTTRPAKPWSKVEDLAIILPVDKVDRAVGRILLQIWRHTFHPYKVYLPIVAAEWSRLNISMPNVAFIPVGPSASQAQRVDRALRETDAEYVAILVDPVGLEEMWVENPLYALMNHGGARQGFLIEGAEGASSGFVVRTTDLRQARQMCRDQTVDQSLAAFGVQLCEPRPEELPFQFDDLLLEAKQAEAEGNWGMAARLFEYAATRHRNELWMKTMAARAYFEVGDQVRASQLSRQVNDERPTIETLLLEARICRKKGDSGAAIGLLERAEGLLEGPSSHRSRQEISLQA
jgi:glycosyltransferase involved in cell wall biosynthesis